MKKFKNFFFLILLIFILNNCGTVRDAFDPQRKNSTDEFLVEKKSPLSMPPDFEKLPVPNSKNNEIIENQKQENNLKKLIVNNQTNNSEIENDDEESIGSFEKLLIEKIKNN